MRKNIIHIIILIILFGYYLIIKYTDFYIPCPIHLLTGWLCPACGVTRMILSMINLDFKQAFIDNPIIFLSSPIIIYLYIDLLLSNIKNKEALYKRIPIKIYCIYIVILLVFMLYRNIF